MKHKVVFVKNEQEMIELCEDFEEARLTALAVAAMERVQVWIEFGEKSWSIDITGEMKEIS